MNNNCNNLFNKDEVVMYAKNNISKLQKVAEDIIQEQGFNYPVTVEIGNFEFPTKKYGDITFPAGFYDALRVKIGESSGKNWWCVMFPPLCFVETTTGIIPDSSKELLQNSLSDESFIIVSESNSSNVAIKFKIVEFFEKAGIITAKN